MQEKLLNTSPIKKKVTSSIIVALLFALIPPAFDFAYTGINTMILENKEPEEFVFYRQPIDSIVDVYQIGEAPRFNFIKTYYQSGHISGKNTIKCTDFRSEVFEASGFVEKEDLNIQTGNIENPFIFGANLPEHPTTCIMRSIITLCEIKFGVCKTVTTESEVFHFQ